MSESKLRDLSMSFSVQIINLVKELKSNMIDVTDEVVVGKAPNFILSRLVR